MLQHSTVVSNGCHGYNLKMKERNIDSIMIRMIKKPRQELKKILKKQIFFRISAANMELDYHRSSIYLKELSNLNT